MPLHANCVCSAKSRGRALKHAGDARLRSSSSGQPPTAIIQQSILEQADSVLLYVYAFWCEDVLSGRIDEKGRLTKPACKPENWKTVFALLNFVRVRAEKQQWPAIISLT